MTALHDHALDSFSAVDADPDTQALVAALDEQASAPAVQRLRATATELLTPRLGQRFLDVGCGLGDVVRALAQIAGAHGRVVGIESSETMLSEARRRSRNLRVPVEFHAGDATRLEFDDASFDGTHCERVFQHLEAPEAAMAELVRVTKPHGRIVVIDTDWGMHAINGADPGLTTRVLECWAQNAANGWSGRRLPELFIGAGIDQPVVVTETFTSSDPQRAIRAPISTMAGVAERSGGISEDDAHTWLAQLADSATRGCFLWAVTMFAVGGTRKPAVGSHCAQRA